MLCAAPLCSGTRFSPSYANVFPSHFSVSLLPSTLANIHTTAYAHTTTTTTTQIFCMHGGLSPELQHMDQIRRVMRPTDVPDTGLLCDLLWSDPDKDIVGWGENDRGVSFTFGSDMVQIFLRKFELDLICRAHQVVEDGYEFFAKRQLVTLFSAPNYCGEFDNAGAMMSVDDTLMCSFQILKPAEKKQRYAYGSVNNNRGGRPATPPRGADPKK